MLGKKMPDILISENIQGVAVDALRERFDVVILPDLWKDPARLKAQIGLFRALIVRNQTQVTAELIAAASKVAVIGRAGAGLDNIDVKAAQRAGIVVTSTPDQNAISVAELCIGMMLLLARHLTNAHANTRAGQWNRHQYMGNELYGKTLGIVGAGRIGFLTAKRAQAFGMKILAYDPFVSPDNILLSELNASLVDIDELLERSDVVSSHLPATPDTGHFFNAARFSRMKRSAFFINASRGSVVCEPDLVAALQEKKIAGAALDVRSVEPPQTGQLETMENVILLPHIAAFTHEAQQRVTTAVCQDVARVLNGQPPHNAVGAAIPEQTFQ